MATCTRFGLLRADEETPAREMLLVEASSAKDLKAWPKLSCKHFVCLLAWDAPASDADIKAGARRLLKEGAVVVGTYGERLRAHPRPDRRRASGP